MIQITQAELLEAIADASRGTAPTEARTVAELVEETGRGVAAIRRALQGLARQGRLGVHRVQRTDITGRPATLPAYTVTPAKRKK